MSTLRLLIAAALTLALATSAGAGRTSGTVPATAIATGAVHSCALIRSGGVRCWGWNAFGQVGDGTTVDRPTPVGVAGLSSGVTAIAAGATHTCALTSAGRVKCWGLGRLGDGTNGIHVTPVDVAGLSSSVAAIAGGDGHTCVLTTTGGVKCWGTNEAGQLGDGTTIERSTPVDVDGLASGVRAITAGGGHTCALTATGRVKCWGYNRFGQVGDGTTTNRTAPVDVGELGGVTAIAAGGYHTCALMNGGSVRCWGDNSNGQLANDAAGVKAIAGGRFETCVVTAASVRCGKTDLGLSGVASVAAGQQHACALVSNGAVKCWGDNFAGQLGDGTTSDRVTSVTPRSVIGLGPARAVLALLSRSVAATPAGIAPVRLRCGPDAACRGTVALSAYVNGKLVGSTARRVQVKLGSRSFSIAAGATQTVDVKISARGLALVDRVKQLRTQVWISYTQPAGRASTATRTITLKAPRKS